MNWVEGPFRLSHYFSVLIKRPSTRPIRQVWIVKHISSEQLLDILGTSEDEDYSHGSWNMS